MAPRRRWGNDLYAGWQAGRGGTYYGHRSSYTVCPCGSWSHDHLGRTHCYNPKCGLPLQPKTTIKAPWYKGGTPTPEPPPDLSAGVRAAITQLQGEPDAATVAAVVAALTVSVGPPPEPKIVDPSKQHSAAVTALNGVEGRMAKLSKNIARVKAELADCEAQMQALENELESASALVQTLNNSRFKASNDDDGKGGEVPAAVTQAPATVNEAMGAVVSMVKASAAKIRSAGAKRSRPAVPLSDGQAAKAKEAQATADAHVERLMKDFSAAAKQVADLAATIQASLPVEEPAMDIDSEVPEKPAPDGVVG